MSKVIRLRPNRHRLIWISLVIGLLGVLASPGLAAQQRWQSDEVTRRELDAKYRLAIRLEQQGHFDQALRIYRYLSDQDPETSRYYQRYTNLLFRLEKYTELEQAIQNYLSHKPDDQQAVIDLGRMYYLRGDTARATTFWDRKLEQFKYSKSFYRALFNAQISLGRMTPAERVILEARTYYEDDRLFALELAGFYRQRGLYRPSAREFLAYARHHQNLYRHVTNQILRFPSDSVVFKDVDSLIVSEIERGINEIQIRRLRAEWLFKFHRYDTARDEVMRIEALQNYTGDEILDFAQDLLKEQRYRWAERVYSDILAQPQLNKLYPQALLGLARALEKEVYSGQEMNPFNYFYPGNVFFSTDYIYGVRTDEARIQAAFGIYDSLATSEVRSPFSAQAQFRLAEIRYRVIRDFDGAYRLYQQVIRNTRDRSLRHNCYLRMGQLSLARGDPEQAVAFFGKQARRFEGSDIEKQFRIYQLMAEYFQGRLDSLERRKSELLGLLGIQHEQFNDVMEFFNFIEQYYQDRNAREQPAFRDFIRAELLIKQNKLSEARALLVDITERFSDDPAILQPVRYRLAQLYCYFDDYDSAAELVQNLLGPDSDLGDDAAFMLAELNRGLRRDDRQAAYWYEQILQKYPNSLHYDQARKQLRALQRKYDEQKQL